MLTDFHSNEAKKYLKKKKKKKSKMADSKKLKFSKPPILKFFSRKFKRLILVLVGLIDVKGIAVD